MWRLRFGDRVLGFVGINRQIIERGFGARSDVLQNPTPSAKHTADCGAGRCRDHALPPCPRSVEPLFDCLVRVGHADGGLFEAGLEILGRAFQGRTNGRPFGRSGGNAPRELQIQRLAFDAKHLVDARNLRSHEALKQSIQRGAGDRRGKSGGDCFAAALTGLVPDLAVGPAGTLSQIGEVCAGHGAVAGSTGDCPLNSPRSIIDSPSKSTSGSFGGLSSHRTGQEALGNFFGDLALGHVGHLTGGPTLGDLVDDHPLGERLTDCAADAASQNRGQELGELLTEEADGVATGIAQVFNILERVLHRSGLSRRLFHGPAIVVVAPIGRPFDTQPVGGQSQEPESQPFELVAAPAQSDRELFSQSALGGKADARLHNVPDQPRA